MFSISEHIEFNKNGRAQCPCCAVLGKDTKRANLSLIPGSEGAYKCHRGCTPEEIRQSLGIEKERQIPRTLAVPDKVKTYTPQALKLATDKLEESKKAKEWLNNRGINDELIKKFRLGIYQGREENTRIYGIGIPIEATETTFFIKRRNCPWETTYTGKEWSQWGIPASLFWGHKPENMTELWITEGEWDAILLGESARSTTIGVLSFTCGCKSVPNAETLSKLPDIPIKIFYDLDDPGIAGAQKVAKAIGKRATIATVPHHESHHQGWDSSDALNSGGFTLDDFRNAPTIKPKTEEKGSIWDNLISNDQLLDRALDYTDWLVPDLLSTDEMFLLAASPRAGKSLMAFSLAHAVATGGKFLGRPCSKGKVLYVRLEDSEAKTKERELAQGWERGLEVYWIDKFNLDQSAELEAVVEKLGCSLLIIDTLSRARRGDISESAAEMSQVIEPLADLAKRQKCTVLLVHHTSKVTLNNANDLNNIFETIRGSSAIRATCRGTMILAAADNSYRLCYENGWGKGDLKIVLDAHTLQWRVLEQWQGPTVELSQKDQVLDVLNRIQQGTIDQIAEATQLPKRSLYEVLKRLQADDLVEKRGDRKSSLYVRKAIQQIQQLNTLLNSSNVEGESIPASIQQNSLPDNISCQSASLPPSGRLAENSPRENVDLLNREPEALPSQGYSYSTGNSTAIQQPRKSLPPRIQAGDRVRYAPKEKRAGDLDFSQTCRGKTLTVVAVEGDRVEVTAAGWVFNSKIPLIDLKILETANA